VGYFLHPQDDVFKASIASRRETLGVVWTTPREERHSVNRDELMADIKVALGGYASEKIFLGATSVGVSSDFQKAMQVASDMVWRCGMGSNGFIGDYTALLGGWQFQQSSSGGRISERTKERLDDEVHKILTECLTDVETLLQQETELVHRFAKELLARNELEYDEIEAIFAEYGKSRTIMPPSTMDTPTDSSSAAS
jgi:cell division protease FtsH